MKHNAKKILKALAIFGLIAALLVGSVAALAAKGGIGKKEAKKIALQEAGVKSSAVKKWIKVRLDNWDSDDDQEWDVEFKTKKYIFSMEIDSITGVVEDVEKEEIRSKISKDKAKSAALSRAGVDDSAVKKWTKVQLDGDEWDVEFKTETAKYEVEVNAYTAEILSFETEEIVRTRISEEKAKSVALKRAKVSSSDVKEWTKVWLDDDEWDVEFKTEKYRFEVEINAYTGKVKDFEKKKLPAVGAAAIQLSKAKEIALNHAKSQVDLSGKKVKYTKAKLERDDGMLLYEIDFRCKGIEFEYEIDANTGEILDWDMDWDD